MHSTAAASCKKRKVSDDEPPCSEVKAAQAMLSSRGMMFGMPCIEDEAAHEAQDAAEAAAASTRTGKAASMPRVRVGNRYLTMHSELVEMTDSTALYSANDFGALRARLEKEGFLFVRGVISPAAVKAARQKMLSHLHSKGAIRDDTAWEQAFIEYQSRWDEKQRAMSKGGAAAAGNKKPRASMGMMAASSGGMMAASGSGMMASSGGGMMSCSPTPSCSGSYSAKKMIPGWTVDAESGGLVNGPETDGAAATKGWHAIGNSAELTAVYNGPALHSFYARLFANEPQFLSHPTLSQNNLPPYSSLPSCTWLRAKGPGEVTAEHADYYYFAKNTSIFGDYFVPPMPADSAEAAASSSSAPASSGKKSAAASKPVSSMTDDERETCQLCHDPRDPASTLICDLCGFGFHMSCLRPRLTEAPTVIPGTDQEQEWHCYRCQNLPIPFWTCWMALGDISGLDGRLALIPGSHTLDGYENAVREDLLPRGFTKSFENAAVWQTPSRIDMGDIILFNLKTIHAATRNAGERFRLSLDTRVTTGLGRKYLEDHGIDSLDPPVKASSKSTNKEQAEESASASKKQKAGSINSASLPFVSKKKAATMQA